MSQDNQTLIPEVPQASRRAILTAAPAMAAAALAGTAVNAAAVAMAKAVEVDPIHAVIAEHQASYVAVTSAFDREDREFDDDEITQAAQQRTFDAEYELFTTAPTTMAGAAAWLDYLGTSAWACNKEQTILEWAFGSSGGYAREFPSFLAASLRGIIARGQA
jgi:hypothetical protein